MQAHANAINFGVTARKNESLEGLIRRFKKKTKDFDLINIVQENRYFTPKSKQRREQIDRVKFLNKKNHQINSV